MKMHKIIKKAALALSILFIYHGDAIAQIAPAPQPCDPGFYDQMRSRAWLEAEREIMQNQNLIFKPDSVLEYTCFDHFVAKAAWEGGDIFTHTTYFGGVPLIERESVYALNNVLERTVFASLDAYRGENFFHALLGGRGEFLDIGAGSVKAITPPPGTEIFAPNAYEYEPYTCDVMAKVWAKAKCLNFVHNADFADNDGFYPFEDLECAEGSPPGCKLIEGYKTFDEVREFPAGLECDPAVIDPRWEEEIITADNLDQELYLFQTPLGEIFFDVAERTIPGFCTDPILTGITIKTSKSTDAGADAVCSNPGCTYNGATCI